MGFNFAGMMQGFGQGLVNSSVLMNEQAKRDWEQQQLMLKLDREEHLENLRLKNQRTLQTENLTAQKEMQQQGFTHAENLTNMQMKQAKELADRSHETQLAEIKASAAARASTAAYQQKALELEEKKYQEGTTAGKLKGLDEQIAWIQNNKTLPDNVKASAINAVLGISEKHQTLPAEVLSATVKSSFEATKAEMENEEIQDRVKAESKRTGIPEDQIWNDRTSQRIEDTVEVISAAAGYKVSKGGKIDTESPKVFNPDNIQGMRSTFRSLTSDADKNAAIAGFKSRGLSQTQIDLITKTDPEFKQKYGVDLGTVLGGFVRGGVSTVEGTVGVLKAVGNKVGEIYNTPPMRPQDRVYRGQ